jgi:hypothetical protein
MDFLQAYSDSEDDRESDSESSKVIGPQISTEKVGGSSREASREVDLKPIGGGGVANSMDIQSPPFPSASSAIFPSTSHSNSSISANDKANKYSEPPLSIVNEKRKRDDASDYMSCDGSVSSGVPASNSNTVHNSIHTSSFLSLFNEPTSNSSSIYRSNHPLNIKQAQERPLSSTQKAKPVASSPMPKPTNSTMKYLRPPQLLRPNISTEE